MFATLPACGGEGQVIKNLILDHIFWFIWLERNRRCFDGVSTSFGILKARCFVNLFSRSNLDPASNAEQFQYIISSLVLT